MLVAQSCLTLCDPMDCSPPGSSVHGILQARILERVVSSFSRGSSWSRDWTWVSCIAGRFFTVSNTREAQICEKQALKLWLIFFLPKVHIPQSQPKEKKPKVFFFKYYIQDLKIIQDFNFLAASIWINVEYFLNESIPLNILLNSFLETVSFALFIFVFLIFCYFSLKQT